MYALQFAKPIAANPSGLDFLDGHPVWYAEAHGKPCTPLTLLADPRAPASARSRAFAETQVVGDWTFHRLVDARKDWT